MQWEIILNSLFIYIKYYLQYMFVNNLETVDKEVSNLINEELITKM